MVGVGKSARPQSQIEAYRNTAAKPWKLNLKPIVKCCPVSTH